MAPFHIDKKHERTILIGGSVVGVVGIGWLFLSSESKHQPTTRSGGTVHAAQPQWMPNPNQASLDQSIVAAKTAALQAYDQSVLGQTQVTAAENVAFNTNLTQKQIAFNTNAAQTQQTSIMATVEKTIAQYQMQAQEAQSQAALQAVQAQQPQWWQYILGSIGSIAGAFGFNFGGTGGVPPYGYTSGGQIFTQGGVPFLP